MAVQTKCNIPSFVHAAKKNGGSMSKATLKQKVNAFIKLGRLKFLPTSMALCLLGALSYQYTHPDSEFSWPAFFSAAVFVWTSHAMTHYSSEYYDYEADMANANRNDMTGGTGVLVNGLLSRDLALKASLVLLAISVGNLLLNPYLQQSIFLGFFIMVWAWQYSGTPLRLQYNSLGEVTVAGVVTGLVPAMGASVQAAINGDHFSSPFFLALVSLLVPLQIVRMMVMNIPDIEGDLKVNKITFTARIGIKNSALVFTFIQMASLLLSTVYWQTHLLPPCLCFFYQSVILINGLPLASRLLSLGDSWMPKGTIAKIPLDATLYILYVVISLIAGLLVPF